MGSFSIWHWLVVLIIVLLIFGTKKLRNMGSDLGGAVKNFKDSMKEGESNSDPESGNGAEPKKMSKDSGRVIDAEVTKVKKKKS